MKTKNFVIIIMLSIMSNVTGQNIELTFTGKNNTDYVQLDSILIKDIVFGNETMHYWPDTVINFFIYPTYDELLYVGYATFSPIGIHDPNNDKKEFVLFQNYPNPITDFSTIPIYLPEKGAVRILAHDILGRQLYNADYTLGKGYHSFKFSPGGNNTYIISALWKNSLQSIKLLVEKASINGGCKIEYAGEQGVTPIILKTQMLKNGIVRESGIVDIPESSSQEYTFQFAYNIPCPGTPTVTYEGQVYNTVQIFSQCWLKESLNVGTMIDNNLNSDDNGVLEKYCHENSEDSCSKYGGLYQWNEMMQYVTNPGTQGICPDGWHIPTDEEWKVLDGAVDTEYGIGNDQWDLYGVFRGIDAGDNMKSTYFWKQNGNGNDSFGFRGVPAGAIEPGGYTYATCMHGLFWTSKDINMMDYPWCRWLKYNEVGIYRGAFPSNYAFSVRCIKD